MPVTGIPLVDWMLTILSAIAVVVGTLVLIRSNTRKLSPEGPGFGNRSDDLRTLNKKHEALSDTVDEHETKIIVLARDVEASQDAAKELKKTVETQRKEQKETNRELFGKLDENKDAIQALELKSSDRHGEVMAALASIKSANQ